VVRPVNVALLEHHKEAVRILVEDGQGRRGHVGQQRVLNAALGDGDRARAGHDVVVLKVATRAAKDADEAVALAQVHVCRCIEQRRSAVHAGRAVTTWL
jgi:hypothetical protein